MPKAMFTEAYNDSDTILVFDEDGSLGHYQLPYTGCGWWVVCSPKGQKVAHVRRHSQELVVQILRDFRAAA